MSVKTGAIMDATIIAAPSSTKNAERAREAEMHQTRKDQQRYVVMRRPLGVDSHSGLAHSAMVTPASVHAKHALLQLLDGDNTYRRQKALIRAKAPQAKDPANERARRRKNEPADDIRQEKHRTKSKVRAKVEPVFAVASDCGVSRRCAVAGWSRMPTVPSRRWHWPISTWREAG